MHSIESHHSHDIVHTSRCTETFSCLFANVNTSHEVGSCQVFCDINQSSYQQNQVTETEIQKVTDFMDSFEDATFVFPSFLLSVVPLLRIVLACILCTLSLVKDF